MAPTKRALASFVVFLLSTASAHVTGTYPVELTAPTPVGTTGRDLANYPQCAVSNLSISICLKSNHQIWKTP